MTYGIVILSYFIGSIPFAYILIRLYTKQDIRTIGSGNVGAMNSYETTGKKWIGFAVFFLDMLKGLAVVLLARLLTNNDFLSVVVAALTTVIGHNYSVFLKFKGGRGLSTAVGMALLTVPFAIVFWGIFWLIGIYIIKKDLVISNVIALICTPVAFYLLPDKIISSTTLLNIHNFLFIKLVVLILCVILFLAHIEPLKLLLSKKGDA